MDSELQKRFEYDLPYDTMEQLKKMFQEQARVERFNVTKSLISCKLSEGGSASAHMLKMLSYVQRLERLDAPVSKEMATDIVFNSLPASYSGFILNYHMHGMDKSLDELHGMLKTAEVDMRNGGSHVLAINNEGRKIQKGKKKGKGKGKKGKGKEKKAILLDSLMNLGLYPPEKKENKDSLDGTSDVKNVRYILSSQICTRKKWAKMTGMK